MEWAQISKLLNPVKRLQMVMIQTQLMDVRVWGTDLIDLTYVSEIELDNFRFKVVGGKLGTNRCRWTRSGISLLWSVPGKQL